VLRFASRLTARKTSTQRRGWLDNRMYTFAR